MSLAHLYEFADGASLCAELAREVAAQLSAGIAERGSASLAVSGGRTPLPLFQALANTELAWEKITITLVDDRWVDVDHKDSNEALVRAHLLQGHAAAAQFISLKSAHATPAEGLAEVEARLQSLPMPLDFVILGMGDDGHTASWFPQAPQLQSALNPALGQKLAWTDPVTAPHLRITLTKPVVEAARRVVLHISGAAKQPVLEAARSVGALDELPIRHIIHSDKVKLDVYWSR